jgi:Sulfotransferase family
LISLAHNFLFVHIPKTAGNSIQNVLRTYSEDKIVRLAPHQDGIERFEVRSDKFNIHKHSTLQDYRAELGDEVFQRLFKFTSVRNPWDRMVSFYFSPHRGPVSWNREQFAKLIAQIPPVTAHVFLEGGSNSKPSCFNNMDILSGMKV